MISTLSPCWVDFGLCEVSVFCASHATLEAVKPSWVCPSPQENLHIVLSAFPVQKCVEARLWLASSAAGIKCSRLALASFSVSLCLVYWHGPANAECKLLFKTPSESQASWTIDSICDVLCTANSKCLGKSLKCIEMQQTSCIRWGPSNDQYWPMQLGLAKFCTSFDLACRAGGEV